MPNLFVSDRELKFFSDIAKEVIKDVANQRIIYFSVSETKTQAHHIYGESLQKVFEGPVILDAFVDAKYQQDTVINTFTTDTQFKLEVFLQYRDLVEKGITVNIGDYFTYSDITYEVASVTTTRNIYGLASQRDGVMMVGTRVRAGQFDPKMFGPTDITYTDEDATQRTFQQQRGVNENNEGETGDVRELVRDGILEPLPDRQRKVAPEGDKNGKGNSFYGE